MRHAEIAQRRAEKDRREGAFAEGREVEWLQAGLGQQRFLGQLRGALGADHLRQLGVLGGGHRDAVLPGAVHGHEAIGQQVIGAGEFAGAADRPGHRGGVQRQGALDLIDQFEGVARLAVHLVDEGDDRDVAHAADFEEFPGLAFDALGGVEHHHGGVHCGEGAVGVLGEILVARRVEQVEDQAALLEGHDRGGDGDAAILLNLHPI